MQAQIDAIKTRVQECIKTAESKFGIKMPAVQVLFDLKGRAAGMAGRRNGTYYLRFNVNHIRLGGKTYEHLLSETVPHEVAHTVCQAFPIMGRNHDTGWKRVCVALGGNGSRTYSENDAPEAVAAMRPYVYITTTGHEVRVTKVIHSKIQSGAGYVMKGGKGKLNRECQYNYMAAPAVASSKAPVIVNTTPQTTVKAPVERHVPAGGQTNASLIRARIAQAKARTESADIVVQWAVDCLGMKTALAKTYVKNNWAKA